MTRWMALPLAVALTVLAAGPALAGDELGVSRDGTTWTADLTAPLFDPSFLWVPDDHQEASFLTRNQSDDPATLQVSVEGSSVDSLLDTGDFHISARGGTGPWTTVSAPGTHTIVKSTRLAAGADERIMVAVEFDRDALNATQRRSLDLRFRVRLTQVSGAPGDGGSGLPGTGGPYLALLLTAAALTAVGVAALTRHRRRADA